eukprot:TRINITY_DN7949_c0_g1_i1.p1 TRINITY_DN7949_c0_g1~~TRINITY_DN7949_c0_g1_i1.p1  ORF type:complete len:127 (+),score=18.59 TRINITY_DN7949_c0_g1_i1:205-585(+)
MGVCSPWDFCGVAHTGNVEGAFFALRIGNRLFDVGLLSLTSGVGKRSQTFQVTQMTNCGTNPCLNAIAATVQIQQDPSAGGWELVVTDTQWSICSAGPYVVNTPNVVLKESDATARAVRSKPRQKL